MGDCDGCVLRVFRESKQVRLVASERVNEYSASRCARRSVSVDECDSLCVRASECAGV